MAIVPATSGMPTSANSKKPKPPPPGVARRLHDEHVDGRAGERQQRAGVRPEHERDHQLRRRPAQPHGHDHDHRQQRGDRAVDADERREERHDEHHQHEQARSGRPRPRDEPLADPGRGAGRVQALADHEQRRDEQHRRVAETGDRLVQRQHAGGPQRERRPDGHDIHGQPVPDEQRPRRDEDRERDLDVGHGGAEVRAAG